MSDGQGKEAAAGAAGQQQRQEEAVVVLGEVPEEDGSELGAGLTRAAARRARAFFQLVARADIGSLPRTMPVQQLAQNMSTAMEFAESVKDAVQHSGTTSKSQRSFITTGVLRTTTQFLKSFVLGTALFSVYEDMQNWILTWRTRPDAPQHLHPHHYQLAVLPNPVWAAAHANAAAGIQGATAGVVAGAVHGALALAWDGVAGLRQHGATAFGLHNAPGVVVNHAVAHGTMFATYEFVHWGVSREQDLEDPLTLRGVGCVALAGAVAGATQEFVTWYTRLFETHGVRGAFRNRACVLRDVGRPGLRGLLAAMPGVALGFVAYEYGRELVGNREDTD